MKILFVSSSRKGKGISPFIFSQGESIKKYGIKVDYFQIGGRGLKNHFLSIFQIRRIIKKIDYDIIHAHYGFSGVISKLANTNCKLIVSYMGGDLLGLVDIDGNVRIGILVLARLNIILANKFNDYNIVKSTNLKSKINNPNTSIIPNGVDLKKFYPFSKIQARNELGLVEEKKYIIFPSSPTRPEKNYRLFQEVIKKIGDNNIEVITFANMTQREVMLSLNAADVLVLTSYFEGSPNVIKEALACNCPIVSTNVGDVKERVYNVENSFVCDFDADKIAQKITQILEKCNRSNGQLHTVEIDIENIAKKLINIYKKTGGDK